MENGILSIRRNARNVDFLLKKESEYYQFYNYMEKYVLNGKETFDSKKELIEYAREKGISVESVKRIILDCGSNEDGIAIYPSADATDITDDVKKEVEKEKIKERQESMIGLILLIAIVVAIVVPIKHGNQQESVWQGAAGKVESVNKKLRSEKRKLESYVSGHTFSCSDVSLYSDKVLNEMVYYFASDGTGTWKAYEISPIYGKNLIYSGSIQWRINDDKKLVVNDNEGNTDYFTVSYNYIKFGDDYYSKDN